MGTVSGLDASKLSLGADFSHYDGDIPGETFKHFDFVWVKACDGDQLRPGGASDYSNYVDVHCHANVQKAWDADIPCGLYIYVQDNWVGWKMDTIAIHHYKALKAATKSLVAGKSYHAIAIDIEASGQTPLNLSSIIKQLADLILGDPEYAPVTKERGVTIYTRNEFLERYPMLRDEISNKNVLAKYSMWLAQWAYPKGGQVIAWAELPKIIDALNMRVLTPGFQSWAFVQWTGERFKIGGSSFPFDLNFFKGDKDACWKWFGYTPRGVVVTPPPDDGGGEDTALAERVARLETELAALKTAYTSHNHSVTVSKP